MVAMWLSSKDKFSFAIPVTCLVTLHEIFCFFIQVLNIINNFPILQFHRIFFEPIVQEFLPCTFTSSSATLSFSANWAGHCYFFRGKSFICCIYLVSTFAIFISLIDMCSSISLNILMWYIHLLSIHLILTSFMVRILHNIKQNFCLSFTDSFLILICNRLISLQ